MKLSTRDTRILLTFVNRVRDPSALAAMVTDDPDFGSKGIGMTRPATLALMETRRELPEGEFRQTDELLKVAHIGPDTLHDMAFSVAKLPAADKALLFFNHVKDAATLTAELESWGPGYASLNEALPADTIIELRDRSPGEGIPSLETLLEIPGLSAEVLERIRFLFEPETTLTPGVARQSLAHAVTDILRADRQEILRASDPLSVVFGKLSSIEIDEDKAQHYRHRYEDALNLKVIGLLERAVDLLVNPGVNEFVTGAPVGILDPASLPANVIDAKWFRTAEKGLFLTPVGAPALIERLEAGSWVEALTVAESVFLNPSKDGIEVRKAHVSSLAPFPSSTVLLPAAPAVRVTCRGGGLGGALLGRPAPLDLSESLPPVPPDWSGPHSEVWINPLPLAPWTGSDNPGPTGFLPGGVIVGGGRSPSDGEPGQPDDGKPTVLIGTFPGISILTGLPWPLPWVWPFPPGVGDKPFIDPGFPGIYVVQPQLNLTVKVQGCECIRRGTVERYTGQPNVEGGDYLWNEADDTIIEIRGPKDEKTVKVAGKDIGNTDLELRYSKDGMSATDSKGISVIYQRFTERDQPRSERTALPVIQPAPKVRIARTPPVHAYVETDLQKLKAKFELGFRGELKDALVDIRQVEVSTGPDFRVSLSASGNEWGRFDNDRFAVLKAEVYGPGRSYVRVRARNNIAHWGTDTLEVNVRFQPHWEVILESLLQGKQSLARNGATPEQVRASDERIARAFGYALESMEVDYAWLAHTDNAVIKAPAQEKWSVAAEDDKKFEVIQIVTSVESRKIDLEEKSGKLLAPKKDPKNYFLLHQDYEGKELQWENDGRLLAAAGEAVQLLYLQPCCAHAGPGVGVELEPPGVKRIDQGESIRLQAVGKPKAWMGVTGTYEWSCIAHPEGARFEFKPGPVTATQSVDFLTDTSGIYTFKVKYALLDAAGSWTYDVADGQIIFNIEAAVVLERNGDYSADDRKDHLHRPYYRERTVKEQPGAEIMVRNRKGGPLGKDFEVTCYCDPAIRFAESMGGKAIFSDGSSREFRLGIDPDFPFKAFARIGSSNVIEKFHIIGIQYLDLPKLKGDAVIIDVRVKPLAPPIADLGDGGVAPPESGDPNGGVAGTEVFVVTDDGPNDISTPESDSEPENPIVNLILRTRDLGNAQACQGMLTLANFEQVNLTQGNQSTGLVLFAMKGMGQVLTPAVVYNSKAATRSEAIARYGEVNGVDEDQLAREFGSERLGTGWSAAWDMQLFVFFDIEGDPLRPRVLKRVEVLNYDGNRIVFQEEFGGRYLVASEAECVHDDPTEAIGQVLSYDPDNDAWTLENASREYWKFDSQGRLVEVGDARMSPASQLQALTQEWSGSQLLIRDSAQRAIPIALDGKGRFDTVNAPNQAQFKFVYRDRLLETIRLPESIEWSYEYGEQSLMTRITPPIGHAIEFEHYLGEDFGAVAKAIAEHYWGRTGKIRFGERELWVEYAVRVPEEPGREQEVQVLMPGNFRWRHHYDPTLQAVVRTEYSNTRSNPDFKLFQRVRYDTGSKLPSETEDKYGAVIRFVNAVLLHGKGRFSLAVYEPGNAFRSTRLTNDALIESATNEDTHTRTYEYYPDRQTRKVTYSPIRSKNLDLQDANFLPVEEYAYDNLGRLQSHRTPDGILTTYTYGGAGDPAGTGLPTAITVGETTEQQHWNAMGWLVKKVTHYGKEVSVFYDLLGRVRRVEEGDGYFLSSDFDALGRLTTSGDSGGRSNSTEFDAYGLISRNTNACGDSRQYLEYDLAGNLLKVKYEDGAIFSFEDYDALGRPRLKKIPDVARRPAGRNGLQTSAMPNIAIEYRDRAQAFSLTGDSLYAVIERAGQVTRSRYFDLRGRLVAVEEAVDGVAKGNLMDYDGRGNLIRERAYHDGRIVGVLGRASFDALGRESSRFDGGTTVHKFYNRIDGKTYTISLLGAPSRRAGRQPSSVTRFDDLGRKTGEFNGEGILVKEWVYDDSSRSCAISILDPDSADRALRLVESVRYNEEARIERSENHTTRIVTIHHYDALHRIERIEAGGEETRYTFDALDRILTVTSPMPSASSVGNPRPGSSAPSVGRQDLVVSHEYDALGRLLGKGSELSKESYEYDALGRVTRKSQSGLGGGLTMTEEFHYNARGEVHGIWMAPDVYKTLVYDHRALKQVETLFENGLEWKNYHSFDVLGQLVAQSADNYAFTFRLSHDLSGRLLSLRTDRQGVGSQQTISEVSLDYGQAVLPDSISSTYADSQRYTAIEYNSNLRPIGFSDSNVSPNGDFRIDYDGLGNQTEIRRPSQDAARSSVEFHDNGRLKRLTHAFGPGGRDSFVTLIDDSDYNQLGYPTRIRHEYREGGQLKRNFNFLELEEHGYDKAGRLVSSVFTGTRGGLFVQTFGDFGYYLRFLFPAVANLLAWIYSDTPARVQKNYYFDKDDRKVLEWTELTPDLADPNTRQTIVQRFRYGAGQAVEEEVKEWYDIGETVPKTIRRKFLYDTRGQRIHEIETLVRTGSTAGAWAQLRSHTYGLSPKPLRTQTYELRGTRRKWIAEDRFVYGPKGEMIWSRHRKMGESRLADEDFTSRFSGTYAELADFDSASSTAADPLSDERAFHYVYAGDELIALLDKDGKPMQEFLNGAASNHRLALRLSVLGKIFEYYNNSQGSALLLTESDGDVEQRFPQAGSYGEAVKKIPEALHAGMWANLTRFLQTPARLYDSSVGQFMTPDPIGLLAGPNLYAFARNNPVAFKDSSGNYWESAWDIASLALGYASFRNNVEKGNFWSAVLDAVGMVIDAVALALPFLPGGVGAASHAARQARAAGRAWESMRYLDRVRYARGVNTALHRIQAVRRIHMAVSGGNLIKEAFHRGDLLQATLGLFMIVLGVQKLAASRMTHEVIEEAYDTRQLLKFLGNDTPHLYERGSKALRNALYVGDGTLANPGTGSFLDFLTVTVRNYEHMSEFQQVLLRGRALEGFRVFLRETRYQGFKGVPQRVFDAFFNQCKIVPLLGTGPTPDSLKVLTAASWGFAGSSVALSVWNEAALRNSHGD